jgi:hypothetical protein
MGSTQVGIAASGDRGLLEMTAEMKLLVDRWASESPDVKIPFPLAHHIAKCYLPMEATA